jgi:predicted dinucleotide-binding enzyme
VTRIGVLGTGVVGQTLSDRFTEVGHDVLVGSRTAKDDRVRTFAEAAAHADLVVNATAGLASIEALTAAGADNLAGKPLLDVANALDFSAGFPPAVHASGDDSLAERIQAAFPDARVVKGLNTMNCNVMARPRSLPSAHTVFLAGGDEAAKDAVRSLLRDVGWTDDEMLDLGDLSAARGLELYLLLWLRERVVLDTSAFNLHLVRG